MTVSPAAMLPRAPPTPKLSFLLRVKPRKI
jgi:hypothetical protein